MKHVAKQIHISLLKNKLTIAAAESCTGGLVSCLLTNFSGSSRYFMLGVVAYSNQAKKSILKISPRLISDYGAVSGEVASLMAERIRKIADADIGIGITGIAGPGGATPQKPVGTVFIALSGRKKRICKKFSFKGDRATVRKKSALKSLELLKGLLPK